MIGAVYSSGPSIPVHGWVSTVILIAAVIAALAVIWKAVMVLARRALKVADLVTKLDSVIKEFQPNHGSSLRDAVDQANDQIAALHAALEAHAAKDVEVQTELMRRLEAIK